MKRKELVGTYPPFVHTASNINSEILRRLLEREVSQETRFIVMDGRKMRNWSGFFQEFSKEFHFPDYFGFNLNSFDEIMQDLMWMSEEAFLILILNADSALSEHEQGLNVLIEYMNRFGEHWATPIKGAEWWDRGSIPFHTVLHFEGDAPLSNAAERLVIS